MEKNTLKTNTKKLAKEFNDKLTKLHFSNDKRSLFIFNLFLCLTDDNFKNNFENCKNFSSLKELLENTLKIVFEREKLEQYDFFSIQLEVSLKTINLDKIPMNEGIIYFLKELNLNILSLIKKESFNDILNEFYYEFIKTFKEKDNKSGIILTPPHIADFFIKLLTSKKWFSSDDKILDITCGSGTLLVTAMKEMLEKVDNNEKKEEIKNHIIGIDVEENMRLLTFSNLIFNQGKGENIFREDSLNLDNNSKAFNKIKEIKPNIGLMNPPYSQGKNKEELLFLLKLLDFIEPGGYVVTILPIWVANETKNKKTRKELFGKHSLLAVITMPKDLFYPNSSINTCIMIWKSKVPHEENKQKTWLATLKDDGFSKVKNVGRVDENNKWESIEKEFLETWIKEEENDIKSIIKCLTLKKEWLAEAYIKTDYKNLKKDVFVKSINNFVTFNIKYNKKYNE